MYSTKDNLELNRIDILENDNLIGYMEYQNIDNLQFKINMPTFVDDNQIINVALQNIFLKALKEKQQEFLKMHKKENSVVDMKMELKVNMGDGTPEKTIIV